MAECPFCRLKMLASSIDRHVNSFHSDDNADHLATVKSRALAMIGGSWDPYEHTIQPRWDDKRFPDIKAPVATRGVWTDDPNSINAKWDPRTPWMKEKGLPNPHKPNWERPRPKVEMVRYRDGFKEVFGPTAANKTQGVRGMSVIRRVGERALEDLT